MRSKARLMSRWTSSGSSRSERDVNPATSTNSTVTCLRSPWSAPALVRIFSARWRGVYAPGDGAGEGVGDGDGVGAAGAATPSPHLSLIHISEPTRLLSISYAVF